VRAASSEEQRTGRLGNLVNYLTSVVPNLIVKLLLQNVVPQSAVLHPFCTELGLCILQFEKQVLMQNLIRKIMEK